MNTGGQVNVVAERGLFAPGDNAFVDSRIFKKTNLNLWQITLIGSF